MKRRPPLARADKRSKMPLVLAALASALTSFGVASAVFLWKFPDVWDAATSRPTAVFRVQSRSMEPAFNGPRFVWNCPQCGETFATSLDVGSSVGVGNFFNVRQSAFEAAAPTSDLSGALVRSEIPIEAVPQIESDVANALENSNADSLEVRQFHQTARFVACPRCGFDRVPALNAVFQDGALVEFTSRFSTPEIENDQQDGESEKNGFVAKTLRKLLLRTEASPESNGPRRWDVVIFRAPNGRATIKRVVGLPGETIEIRNGDVFVDGKIARRSLDEAFATSTRIDSVDFCRDASRLAFTRVAPIWSDEPIPENARISGFPQTKFVSTSISNESTTPHWNGIDVAPIEQARDFLAQFTWSKPDALPVRFAVLARRPTQAFWLEFDEKTSQISLRSIPLLNSKSMRGKTFDQLNEIDFLEALPKRISFESTPTPDAKRFVFRIFLVDGELILARDGRELARFSTDDVNSTEKAAISEPFIIFGDAARIGAPTLRRDLHYSTLPDSLRNDETAPVPPNRYFLLGDNSPASLDSRFESFGTVDERDILFRVAKRPPNFDDF